MGTSIDSGCDRLRFKIPRSKALSACNSYSIASALQRGYWDVELKMFIHELIEITFMMPVVNLERPTDSYASTIYLYLKHMVVIGFVPLIDWRELKPMTCKTCDLKLQTTINKSG